MFGEFPEIAQGRPSAISRLCFFLMPRRLWQGSTQLGTQEVTREEPRSGSAFRWGLTSDLCAIVTHLCLELL